MSFWDEADALLSAAVDDVLGEPVVWRPMRGRASGRYTNQGYEPDPDRPVRGQDDPLEAIVSWQSELINQGAAGDEQATVQSFDCVVDFHVSHFVDPATGEYSQPRVHDMIEVPDAYAGNSLVQVSRVGGDGSQRVMFYCSLPQQ